MDQAITEEHLLQDARKIFESALLACSVERAFERKMRVTQHEGTTRVYLGDNVLDLTQVRHLRIVSAGKAGSEMLSGFLSRVSLSRNCDLKGVLIARDQPANLPDGIQFYSGGHPLPNQASFDGAIAALDLVKEASALPNALCLFFISGGASAMMELPLVSSISIEDTGMFYQALVQSGAKITEINCIRKHFSAIKGGRLAFAAGSTPTFTLLVSDVPPQQLDSLSSGPTLPDSSTVQQCLELLSRAAFQSLPQPIQSYFAASVEETPKPAEIDSTYYVLLDSDELAEAAARRATEIGYHVEIDNTCDDWAYDAAAEHLLGRLRILRTHHDRVCLISTGEVTIAVQSELAAGQTHSGGRNQHFALHAATLLSPADRMTAVLSAGSDGIDGNSSAAGGVISSFTLHDEATLQQAQLALAHFDSSTFLESIGATIVTGPTGNNLRDLRILLSG